MGGEITAPIPESMRITGTVVDWEAWTGMAFPESGDYVLAGASSSLASGCNRRFVETAIGCVLPGGTLPADRGARKSIL
jgi:hypothetical protein